MIRKYGVGLDLIESIPLDVFGTSFREYMESSGLVVPEKTFKGGSILIFQIREGTLMFDSHHLSISPLKALDEMACVKLGLVYGARME